MAARRGGTKTKRGKLSGPRTTRTLKEWTCPDCGSKVTQWCSYRSDATSGKIARKEATEALKRKRESHKQNCRVRKAAAQKKEREKERKKEAARRERERAQRERAAERERAQREKAAEKEARAWQREQAKRETAAAKEATARQKAQAKQEKAAAKEAQQRERAQAKQTRASPSAHVEQNGTSPQSDEWLSNPTSPPVYAAPEVDESPEWNPVAAQVMDRSGDAGLEATLGAFVEERPPPAASRPTATTLSPLRGPRKRRPNFDWRAVLLAMVGIPLSLFGLLACAFFLFGLITTAAPDNLVAVGMMICIAIVSGPVALALGILCIGTAARRLLSRPSRTGSTSD